MRASIGGYLRVGGYLRAAWQPAAAQLRARALLLPRATAYLAGSTVNRCAARSGHAYMAALIVSAGLVALVTSEAEAQRGRGFDAVGGGASSAMSFGQSGGVAWRIYPPGGRDGFEAGAKFQSYKVSPLVQRMEGMEGNIWGENLWRAQENQNSKREAARSMAAGEGGASSQGLRNSQVSAAAAVPTGVVTSSGSNGLDPAQTSRRSKDRLTADTSPKIASKDPAVAAALNAEARRNGSTSKAKAAEAQGQPWWTGAR